MRLTFNDIRLLLPVRSPRQPTIVAHCAALHALADSGNSLILDATAFLDESELLNPRVNFSLSQNDENPLQHADTFVKRFGMHSSSWYWSNLRVEKQGICLDLTPLLSKPMWAPDDEPEEHTISVFHLGGLVQVKGSSEYIDKLVSPEQM